jgi:hypothetical protein
MPKIFILEPTELYAKSQDGYSLNGWDEEQLNWPMEMGRCLGQAGAYNFFLRAGYNVKVLSRTEFSTIDIDDLLIVDIPLDSDLGDFNLDELMNINCRLLLSGNFIPIASFFDVSDAHQISTSSPYNSFGIDIDLRATPLQPANWAIYGAKKTNNKNSYGDIFEIAGDRLSPATALRIPVNDSFLTIRSNKRNQETVFVNGHIFSALQSWLQGQEDLTQWLSWNSRQHWLDDFVDTLMDGLSIDLDDMEKLKGIPETSICLRHDNDDSTNSDFAKIEHDNNIQGTFALLDDHNLDAWKEIQCRYPEHEYVLHYTTITPKYNFPKLVRIALSLTPFKSMLNAYLIGSEVLSKGKLSKQVTRAKEKGIGTDTLHRHFAYVPYPEIIEEFDGVYQSHSNILATSSFFRSNIYRWGAKELDGAVSTNAPWPDSQFPFWMPFKTANAARAGKISEGWENTLLMECEPEFVTQVLKVKHKNLPHKFMTFCYHPSNSLESNIRKGGTLPWLSECIKRSKDSDYSFTRYDTYIKLLNKSLNND